MVDALLVAYFVFFECLSCVTLRAVVNELVATGTKEHKIVDIVDILWSCSLTSPWAVWLEGHHMRNLCEVALSQCKVVF
jgi:hypothetical protein